LIDQSFRDAGRGSSSARGPLQFSPLRRGAPFSPLAKGAHHFSPPCEGGVRGGGLGTTSHKVFARSLSQSIRIPLDRREEPFSTYKASASPPPTPPSQGGERDRCRLRRGKALLPHLITPSGVTERHVSRSPLQLSQTRLFNGPALRPCAGSLQTRAVRLDPRTASVQNARVDVPDRLARGGPYRPPVNLLQILSFLL